MNLSTELIDGVCVVNVNEKRVDRQVSDEFKKDLEKLIDKGNYNIVMNLSNVEYMDSGGLGVIVASLKLLQGRGEIIAYGFNEVVSKILTLSGLRNYLKTAFNQKEAIDLLKK
jgi:anti-sigma B factor antagonist